MKFNLFLIFCLCINITLSYNKHEQSQSSIHSNLITAKYPSHRFLQSKTALVIESTLNHNTIIKPINFKVTINIIKETDATDEKYINIDTTINLNKDTIDFFKNNKIYNTIAFSEFQFWDGNLLYNKDEDFKSVHTPNYKYTMDKLKPKIDSLISLKGIIYFSKYCSVAIRKKLNDPNDISKGQIFTSIMLCFKEEETETIINKFKEDFTNHFTNSINLADDLLSLQQFEDKQSVSVQFYDPSIDLKGPTADLPNYYTSFSPEGLVMSTDQSGDLSKVKFSFRFDQILNCKGNEARVVKDALDPKVSALFKSNECCVSYTVDWNLKPLNDMFCSTYNKAYRCKIDIRIFQASMYNHCMTANLNKLTDLLKETNGDLSQANVTITKRSQMVNILREINKNVLLKYLSQSSTTYEIIRRLKPKAQSFMEALLKGMANEIQNTGNNNWGQKSNKSTSSDFGEKVNEKSSPSDLIEKMKQEMISEIKEMKIKVDTTSQNQNIDSSSTQSSSSSTSNRNSGSGSGSGSTSSSSSSTSSGSSSSTSSSSSSTSSSSGITSANSKIQNEDDSYKSGININVDVVNNILTNKIDTGIVEKLVIDKNFQLRKSEYSNKTEVKCPNHNENINEQRKDAKNLTEIIQKKIIILINTTIANLPIDDPTEFNSDDDFNNLNVTCAHESSKIPVVSIPKNKTINLPIYERKQINNNENLNTSTNNLGKIKTNPTENKSDEVITYEKSQSDIPMSFNTGIISPDDALKIRKNYLKKPFRYDWF